MFVIGQIIPVDTAESYLVRLRGQKGIGKGPGPALFSVVFFDSLLLLLESSELSATSCNVELGSSSEEAAATFWGG